MREYAGTFLAQGLVLIGQLVAFRVAATSLGPEGFSEFALTKRTLSVLQPLTWMGMGVALPRFLADTRLSEEERNAAYGTTIVSIGSCALIAAGALVLFSAPAAALFFGDGVYAPFMPVLGLQVVAMAAHAVAYSYFRGILDMSTANLLYVINLGIVPVACLAAAGTALQALAWMGMSWLGVSAVWLIRTPLLALRSVSWEVMRPSLRYGVPRMPGQLAAMALLTAPATLASHQYGIVVAGSVAFGTSILGMAAAAFSPVSLVLLPRASQMLAEGHVGELRTHVHRLLAVTGALGIAATVVLAVFGRQVVVAFLGPDFGTAVQVIRVASLGILPYSLYIVCRGLIDAFHDRAVTTLQVLAGLGLFSVWAALRVPGSDSPLPVVMALTGGLSLLGSLCLIETFRILRVAYQPNRRNNSGVA